MKRLLLGITLALMGSAAQAAGQTLASESLMIRNITVVSADRPAPLPGVDVLIRDGRIVRIGAALSEHAEQEIDGTGRYLTPGLIDSHVHVSHATGLRGRYTPDYESLYREYLAQAPSSYLYFGYTTLIELNAEAGGREAFEATSPHPTLLDCSQGIDLLDGFMAADLPPGRMAEHFPNYLYDPSTGAPLPEGVDPADHSPEAVVAKVVEAGGICVKLYYEQALWWQGDRPEFALPDVDILRRIDKAANSAGLVTVLHATTPEGHTMGMRAGIDILAHGLWEWPDIAYMAPTVPAEVQRVLEEEARTGVSLQPTIQTLRNTASMFDPAALQDPRLSRVLPARYLTYLRTAAQAQRDDFLAMFGDAFAAQPGATRPGIMLEVAIGRYERQTAWLNRNGANLLFGTDTAVGGPGWGNPPGLNGLREMQDWARGGVPLKTIFEAATLGNARAFGLDDQIGAVAPGLKADLLILGANPLETLDAYDRVDTVILGGHAYDRQSFSAEEDNER